HRWLTALFEDLHSQPRIEYWALEYDTQVEFVRAMGALALVPRLGRPHLPSDVTVVPLDDPAIARTIHLVCRQTMSSSPAISRLLEQMQAIAGADETAAESHAGSWPRTAPGPAADRPPAVRGAGWRPGR